VRVLLDTNVLISALFRGGNPRKALERCIRGEDELILCRIILDEVDEVLAKPKFGIDPIHRVYFLKALEDISDLIPVDEPVEKLCRDPDDDFILACAVRGRAERMVTGDDDLLSLHEHAGIPVLTVRAHLESV